MLTKSVTKNPRKLLNVVNGLNNSVNATKLPFAMCPGYQLLNVEGEKWAGNSKCSRNVAKVLLIIFVLVKIEVKRLVVLKSLHERFCD